MLKKYIFLLLLSLLLVGCGFHLRKPKPLPPEMHTLYLDSSSPYSDLTLQVTQLLKSLHITLVSTPDDALLTLKLASERYTQDTASESASSKTKQYRMRFRVDYSLQDQKGAIIYGPKSIRESRIYTVEEDQVLSSSTQDNVLKKEMQQEAAYRIITELSSPQVLDAVANYENKTRTVTTNAKQ